MKKTVATNVKPADSLAAVLPTTQVDPIVGFVARTITDVVRIDDDQDGRVEGAEILSFSWKRSQDAFATFRGWNLKEFRAQFGDLDEGERKAQIEIFAKAFDLRNDDAEFLIEDWLRWMEQGATLIGRTRRVMQKS